jgi:hypothetical protein
MQVTTGETAGMAAAVARPAYRRWRPRNQEELEGALEEYAAFSDGTQVRRYGRDEGPGTRPGADYDAEWERIVCRQNPEIDLRMGRLLCRGHRCYSPTCWKILHLFYRRGLCYESRGWEIVAARVGLPVFRWRDGRNKKHFQKLLDVAIEQLWLASGDR